MSVLTTTARKKYFMTKYRVERIDQLEDKIFIYEEKAAWLKELVEEKRNAKRRQSSNSAS